jgi:hypothetical protein
MSQRLTNTAPVGCLLPWVHAATKAAIFIKQCTLPYLADDCGALRHHISADHLFRCSTAALCALNELSFHDPYMTPVTTKAARSTGANVLLPLYGAGILINTERATAQRRQLVAFEFKPTSARPSACSLKIASINYFVDQNVV